MSMKEIDAMRDAFEAKFLAEGETELFAQHMSYAAMYGRLKAHLDFIYSGISTPEESKTHLFATPV
jgi:hypothetical protein